MFYSRKYSFYWSERQQKQAALKKISKPAYKKYKKQRWALTYQEISLLTTFSLIISSAMLSLSSKVFASRVTAVTALTSMATLYRNGKNLDQFDKLVGKDVQNSFKKSLKKSERKAGKRANLAVFMLEEKNAKMLSYLTKQIDENKPGAFTKTENVLFIAKFKAALEK